MDLPLRVVFTTVDDEAAARHIAHVLVEERLVACAQVESNPLHSVWTWEGETQSGAEWRLMFKTVPAQVDPLRERLEELHPYDIPEFVVLHTDASEAYARWAEGSCS
ncbi:divalent-cation tolerance protein CutA [bacterium]|nr:MAG: divalent-cation tolerance protein CutA [bacterium]RKZ12221.1 MAG: divalent-cation tolerance protein CutA [bacterium]